MPRNSIQRSVTLLSFLPLFPIITIIIAINIYIITNMIVITKKKGAHQHGIRTKHHREKPVVGDGKSA